MEISKKIQYLSFQNLFKFQLQSTPSNAGVMFQWTFKSNKPELAINFRTQPPKYTRRNNHKSDLVVEPSALSTFQTCTIQQLSSLDSIMWNNNSRRFNLVDYWVRCEHVGAAIKFSAFELIFENIRNCFSLPKSLGKWFIDSSDWSCIEQGTTK